MLKSFGQFIVKWRWLVIGTWSIAGALIVSLSPNIQDYTNNDQASFLPSSYESAEAQKLAKEAFPQSGESSALIVFKRTDNKPLTADDKTSITQGVTGLNAQKIDKVKGAITGQQQLSPDGKVQLARASLSGQPRDEKTLDAVKAVRSYLSDTFSGTGIEHATTGQVAVLLDTQDSFSKAQKIVGIVTILLILVLPGIIFRSPIAAFLPVVSVSIVFLISNSVLALAAKIFDFELSAQLNSLLIVVLFGIGTDYILFLLFRYREKLRSGNHTRGAVSFALSRAGEAIFSAALVVIAAFSALFFAKLGSLSALAPALVISVSVMLIASLTLVPALLAIVGERIFWPSKKWMSAPQGSISKNVGGFVARKPGTVSVAVLILLIALSSGIFSYKGDFDIASSLPENVESVQALNSLKASFPEGASSPTNVYVFGSDPLDQNRLGELVANLNNTRGVANTLPAQLSPDGRSANITVILKEDPSSDKALGDVAGPIRDTAHAADIPGKILVGGETATFADIRAATNRDLSVILPVAAGLIFIILAILLRSLAAPIVMLLIVGLVYAATLGTATYLFTGIGDAAGLTFFLPIILYVFVVAIGTDYNILTATRLREENTEGHDPRKAADMTIEHSSATVISAGIILAGTFLSLAFTGISLLSQMGLSVSIGIALAAFLASIILLPSLSALIGKRFWWPSSGRARR
ncbi:hypothetical protein COU91_02250 [Candidatus Saccharibacteria bacterium CG10_big_fil_rev_8_21_14_0_10_47_8]|nr:MAG: hypothetical protein COU91_02250 [Candidatus Saccharibacteria bacterium CG10_big_fil_rev_8_21_14_0_10_47_8]